MAEREDFDNGWDFISDLEVKAVREFSESLETQNITSAVQRIQTYFRDLDEVLLNIAVTGESGSGKSSFVNALRGLGDEEEDSAPTGVVETTTEPTAYPHPKYPNVILWDLPGVGTQNFKADTYLEQVEFDRYDFFIIIASERFRSSNVDLATQIQKMKKKFYFVRSKIDVDVQAEKRRKSFDQKLVLDRIRQDCIQGLVKNGVDHPAVFLISSYELGNYDINALQDTMEKELPDHKRDMLLLALPNVTMKIHQKKREALGARVWKMALLSAGIAAVPIPGLSICTDVAILVTEIKEYYQAFGLDEESLENLSNQMEVPVEEFRACLKSPLNKEISADVVVKMLTKAAGAGMMVAGHVFNMLPLLGSLPAGALSFASTKLMLESCLKELAADAQSVLMRALQTEV
ncbi:LOW QUALITY PROTEIN: interferon-inducible GTPase 5-like [Alosa alosa]|uniref:LOW QUALITY PROTEIN: interferon-inducible GTPase 5-like n=1 Tax=Alosa alosa TaxID=278164 RepID=UPI0020152879|nr:LOW QUALITY PROTEIN: interferon-inducible GTPase 5-like [Alosa alosa]